MKASALSLVSLVSLALSSVLAPGCSSNDGIIGVTLVAAPMSDLLGRTQHIRVTVRDQEGTLIRTEEGTRAESGGLSVSLDLAAEDRFSDVSVEAFDQSNSLIAVGSVGPLPLQAITAEVVVYLAAPMSIAEAPVSLDPPRSHAGSAAASFGVLIAGGRDDSGPIANVDVYSAYLHRLQVGQPIPTPAADPTVFAGSGGIIYLVGGIGANEMATSESYAFNTTVAPAGVYEPLAVAENYARSGASVGVIGENLFLIGGDPGLVLDGVARTIRPLLGGERLDGAIASLATGSSLETIVAGAEVDGAALYKNGTLTRVESPAELLRAEHVAATLPSGEALFIGGHINNESLSSAVVYQPGTQSFQSVPLLATPRRRPAIAITKRYLLVIGGHDDNGLALADVEVFASDTLAPVAVLPLVVPRRNATAQALANGQVLIAGGQDLEDNPISTLELFTPDLVNGGL